MAARLMRIFWLLGDKTGCHSGARKNAPELHIYDSYDEVVDCYDLGLPPTQDSSHHQDYEPFLENREPQLLNLHLPLESWVGVDPSYDCYDCYDPQDW